MKHLIYRQSVNIKRLLVLSALVMIIALLNYSQNIVNRLRQDSTNLLRFYAEVYAKAATDYESSDFSFIFDQIIRKISIPMVISREISSEPTAWKGIGLDTTDFSPANLTKVTAIMLEMDRMNTPIPLQYMDYTLGYIHYGEAELIRKLRLLPFIEIAVVTLFIFLGYLAFQILRSSEKRSIWVGMAKETAHQLGTPLSSLMGWVEILKMEQPVNENLADMGKDLKRLEKVTTRFSQIGSPPLLKEAAIDPVIEEAVAYYQRRLPQLGPHVTLEFAPINNLHARINADLFAWAIENLIKNALDAVPAADGRVRITTQSLKNGRWIAIDVSDNGVGILKKNRKNIFRPGFSSKKRGWGLGLSLTKRIIEEYHHGRIFVLESKPGERTVMRILLRASDLPTG